MNQERLASAIFVLITTVALGIFILGVVAAVEVQAQEAQVEKPEPMERFDPYWEQFRGPKGKTWHRTYTGDGWIICPGSYGVKYNKHPPFYIPDGDKSFLREVK